VWDLHSHPGFSLSTQLEGCSTRFRWDSRPRPNGLHASEVAESGEFALNPTIPDLPVNSNVSVTNGVERRTDTVVLGQPDGVTISSELPHLVRLGNPGAAF